MVLNRIVVLIYELDPFEICAIVKQLVVQILSCDFFIIRVNKL